MRAPRSVPRPSPAGSDKGRVGAEAVGGCVLTPPLCFLQYDQHVISPKEFVHLAGKSTLKDWKRAIRMNGIMLRWAAGRAAWGGLGEAACWRPGRAAASPGWELLSPRGDSHRFPAGGTCDAHREAVTRGATCTADGWPGPPPPPPSRRRAAPSLRNPRPPRAAPRHSPQARACGSGPASSWPAARVHLASCPDLASQAWLVSW